MTTNEVIDSLKATLEEIQLVTDVIPHEEPDLHSAIGALDEAWRLAGAALGTLELVRAEVQDWINLVALCLIKLGISAEDIKRAAREEDSA